MYLFLNMAVFVELLPSVGGKCGIIKCIFRKHLLLALLFDELL